MLCTLKPDLSHQHRGDRLGRTLAHRERYRGLVRRAPPRPDVPHPHEPLDDHPPALAFDGLHGIYCRRRSCGLRDPPVHHWPARVQIWYRIPAAVVSVDLLYATAVVLRQIGTVQHRVNDVDAHRHLGDHSPRTSRPDMSTGVLSLTCMKGFIDGFLYLRVVSGCFPAGVLLLSVY